MVQVITPFALAMGSQGQESVGRPMTSSLISKLTEKIYVIDCKSNLVKSILRILTCRYVENAYTRT